MQRRRRAAVACARSWPETGKKAPVQLSTKEPTLAFMLGTTINPALSRPQLFLLKGLANSILGGWDGNLMRILRREEKFVYSVNCNVAGGPGTQNSFQVQTSFLPDQAELGEQRTKQIVSQFCAGNISNQQINQSMATVTPLLTKPMVFVVG